ncbi:MAG: PP2C family serine/threonine-protein phosphatase [Acidobacteriota bacterium]
MEDNFEIASASITDRGLSDKRPQNEDSYLEMSQHGIFAVADGVGGAQAGDVASQMAMEILGEAFANRPATADPEAVMQNAIESANTAIFQMSHDLPQLATMATTIVALHLEGNIATIGHVGDSRLYRVDSGGVISQETNDHSVVAEEVRAGRMTPEQAAVHPSRNVISRALGAEPTVEIDLKTMMVEPGTSFILCSDGITRHIQDWELESILKSEEDLSDICFRLKQICYDRGAEDNLTAVVVKIKNQLAPSIEIPIATHFAYETEEDTVATARSPFNEIATPIHTVEDPITADESSTPSATFAADDAILAVNEPFAIDEDHILQVDDTPITKSEENGDILDLSADTHAAAAESEPFEFDLNQPKAPVAVETPEDEAAMVEPALVEHVPVIPTSALPSATLVRPVTTYAENPVVPPSRSGFFGSFLSSLVILVIGALAGAAGIYFLVQPSTVAQQQSQQPTPILTPKVDDVPRTSFEESRRLIDADPTKYLEANKAWDPDASAADFYLKGRAFLRIGEYFQAKQALNEARKRLKADDPDAATLNMEISIAQGVINSGAATESLRNDLAAFTNAASANSAVNANSNNANAHSNQNANR